MKPEDIIELFERSGIVLRGATYEPHKVIEFVNACVEKKRGHSEHIDHVRFGGYCEKHVALQPCQECQEDVTDVPQACTSDEWLANCPQSVRDLAKKIKDEVRYLDAVWSQP